MEKLILISKLVGIIWAISAIYRIYKPSFLKHYIFKKLEVIQEGNSENVFLTEKIYMLSVYLKSPPKKVLNYVFNTANINCLSIKEALLKIERRIIMEQEESLQKSIKSTLKVI